MDKTDAKTNDQNRKAMEFLETEEELMLVLKELYDGRYLSGICYVEGVFYRSNYFRQEISVLADAIYGPVEELIGPRDGVSTYVEKHPGIFGRRGEEAKDLLMGAYEIKKELLLKLPERLSGEIEKYVKRLYPLDDEAVQTEIKEVEMSLYLAVKDEMNRNVESGKKMLNRRYIRTAYEKTRKELGADENSNGSCLPELMRVPEGIAVNEIWEKQKYFFSVVKQMVWNLILESWKDGCFKGQERKRG